MIDLYSFIVGACSIFLILCAVYFMSTERNGKSRFSPAPFGMHVDKIVSEYAELIYEIKNMSKETEMFIVFTLNGKDRLEAIVNSQDIEDWLVDMKHRSKKFHMHYHEVWTPGASDKGIGLGKVPQA